MRHMFMNRLRTVTFLCRLSRLGRDSTSVIIEVAAIFSGTDLQPSNPACAVR